MSGCMNWRPEPDQCAEGLLIAQDLVLLDPKEIADAAQRGERRARRAGEIFGELLAVEPGLAADIGYRAPIAGQESEIGGKLV